LALQDVPVVDGQACTSEERRQMTRQHIMLSISCDAASLMRNDNCSEKADKGGLIKDKKSMNYGQYLLLGYFLVTLFTL